MPGCRFAFPARTMTMGGACSAAATWTQKQAFVAQNVLTIRPVGSIIYRNCYMHTFQSVTNQSSSRRAAIGMMDLRQENQTEESN
jgi:hypothetical protein